MVVNPHTVHVLIHPIPVTTATEPTRAFVNLGELYLRFPTLLETIRCTSESAVCTYTVEVVARRFYFPF